MLPIPRSFYERNTVDVAHDLIGKVMVRVINGHLLSGMIVEAEAYQSGDEACHAYDKKTKRNQALFGQPGHLYIYTIHKQFCVNIVSHDADTKAGGVLIRALEPLQGIAYMQENRPHVPLHNLTNGPGKLCQALQITAALYGHDVTELGPLYIVENEEALQRSVIASKRIGISKAQDKLWRFYLKANRFVSRKK